MKSVFLASALTLTGGLTLLVSTASAQLYMEPQRQKETRTATFTVKGNCDQCKARIESALDTKGVKKAVWDKRTKVATVTYVWPLTDVPTLRSKVASAGHDTDSLEASPAAYRRLPECCTYRTNGGHTH